MSKIRFRIYKTKVSKTQYFFRGFARQDEKVIFMTDLHRDLKSCKNQLFLSLDLEVYKKVRESDVTDIDNMQYIFKI